MVYLPVIGAFLEAAGTILEKKVLKKKGINSKNYTVYEFFSIVVTMLPILYFTWGVKKEAFIGWNLAIFAFVVGVSIAANLLIFYSLKRENISEFEPIWLMQPLFTIVLAFIFYQSERNWLIVGLAIVASTSLVLAHIKKHHLVFDRYIIAALLGCFLFSVELVASKPILHLYSPFSFYFLRCLFIFLICFVMFRPNGKELNKRTGLMILIIGLMWAFYRAIIYYGYGSVGIVFTTTLFILSPVFMLIFAVVFLKEKPTWRQIISTVVILACVVLAVVFDN